MIGFNKKWCDSPNFFHPHFFFNSVYPSKYYLVSSSNVTVGNTVLLRAVVAKRVKRNCIRLECAYYRIVTRTSCRPDTMYFLPHLYNRQNLRTQVDHEEIDELHPSITVELQDYCPEFGEFCTYCVR